MDLSKTKLLKFPVFIIVHIALVAIIFKIVYPEVELSSLSLVIGGTGLCFALITNYLYKKSFLQKEKQQNSGESPDESK